MSAQVTIAQLPSAGAITGTELVPVVQNGVTVKTTTAALAGSPVQTQTFITKNQEATLANSRALSNGTGVGLVDGGAQSTLTITLNAASGSLEAASNGMIAKTASNAVVARTMTSSTTGLSVTNGDGVAGAPAFALTGVALAVAGATGTGALSLTSPTTVSTRQILGTASQIAITDGNFVNSPVIAIASDPILPGSGGLVVPVGTTGQRGSSTNGNLRYNTTTATFEGYANNAWGAITTGTGVTSVATGTGLTGGTITSTGTISIANTAVTAGTYGSSTNVGQFTVNAQGQLTFAGDVAISASSIGAVTSVSGTANEITATGTTSVILALPAALTFTGKTVTGGAFNMTSASVGADTVTTNTAAQTLTSKTISGASNTLTNIANASLTNSAVTINGSPVSLGGSITVTATATNALTIGTGLTGTSYNGSSAVTIGIDSTVATLTGTQTLTNKTISGSNNTLTNIANASLTNSSVTVGTTAIALGASSLTLGGLTSVAVTQDPIAALDLATKQYVDALAQGLDPKASCVAATTANITLSGTQTIDGVALIAGDRCLVKDQTLSQNNGIYLVAAGAWTRATDMDSWLEVPGAFTFIEQGTLYADTGWVCTSNAGGTLGTTPITWVQFAGVGSYTAGTGLTLTGTQFSITNTAVTAASYGSATQVGTFTVNAQGQLTSAASTSIAINGNQITSGTVAVVNGGTGATNATDARTNLVAAKSGTNSDITELYALNGTSGGVAFQNAGNQLTMGANLTFDGSMLFVPGGISGGTF